MPPDRRIQLHRSFSSTAAAKTGGPDRLPAVVLCPGLIQNRYTFEAPTRSLPAFLRRRGYCVYILEPHGRASMVAGPRYDGIAHVVEHDIAPTVRDLCARHPAVGFLGHSLGGILGLGLPDDVRPRLSAIITVGTPLLPAVRVAGMDVLSPLVARAARVLQRRGVAFPGRLIGALFLGLRPLVDFRPVRYPLMIFAPASLHPVDLRHFLARSFATDSFGVVADLLDLGLAAGERTSGLHLGAHLDDVGAPLFVVGGSLDGLAPPTTVQALYDRAAAPEKQLRIFGPPKEPMHFGHVDLVLGRAAPDVVWPALADFLDEHVAARASPSAARLVANAG